MNEQDQKKLTFLGVSPIIFLTTVLYAVPIIVINHFFRQFFEIKCIPNNILIGVATVLLCIGIPLYVATLKMLKAAYKNQELVTGGLFSICRNPLFAVVIFMLLPGIVLFFNSWLLLTIPVFMVVMFKIFIHGEESLMEREFREEYIQYKNRTPALFPKFWKFRK